MKTILNYKSLYLFSLFLLISLLSCNKMLEVDAPVDKYTGKLVYEHTDLAVLVMNGIYDDFRSSPPHNYTEHITGLLSDELQPNYFREDLNDLYTNSSNSVISTSGFWTMYYRKIIYGCNAVVEGASASDKLSESVKHTLIGEAKFTRALMYFNLVNLFGDVPLVNSTDFVKNSNIGRTDVADIYRFILDDLTDAQNKLSQNYLDVDLKKITTERVRPNKAAATALLARVHLYLGHWPEAIAEATKVIEQTSQYSLLPLDEVFKKNSKEAIWQLQSNPKLSSGTQQNSQYGDYFLPYYSGVADKYILTDVKLSDLLMGSFEVDDLRKTQWTRSLQDPDGNTFTIPFKYRVGKEFGDPSVPVEYDMVLRLGEQYLIRAEANVQQGNLTAAKNDLDEIRKRAGLQPTDANSHSALLQEIDHERYVELFTEFGHRWFDLKRRGTLNSRMAIVSPLKGGGWSPEMALLGIPYEEFLSNPKLRGHQNPGYRENR